VGDPFSALFESGNVLDRVGLDLTALARRGDLEPVRCREHEIARVVDILLRQSKNNPALVGKAGVGKTAIAEGLAQRIASGAVPPALKDARLVALDHVSLLAGTMLRGQYEERVRRLVQALEQDPDLILFVDELHNLIGQGTAIGAAMDAANMLKPALVRGDIRIIGATTGEEYDRWIRGDPALERRFQPVLVEELDTVQTWEVLVARRPRLERHHAVAISDDALRAAIVLTDQFIPARARPDKAIDVLDEACAHAQAQASVSPELDRLIRERRRVDAAIRRGKTHESEAPPGDVMLEIGPMLDRIFAEIETLLGVRRRSAAGEGGRGETEAASASSTSGTGPRPASPDVDRRPSSLTERRQELDRLLRAELERQGIVVTGQEIARVVGAAAGKTIEWTG
jgi:ATP-dependent Clp protease ATP-binding subunit ClpA